MALTLLNFSGFGTNGLEEAVSTSGVPQVNTNQVRNGTYSLELLGGSTRPVFDLDATPHGPSRL